MSSLLEELLVLLKKKKTIAILVSILLGFVLMKLLITVFKEDIREQQIASVGETVYVNKQFVPVKENEVMKLAKNKEQTIIALVETADNKGLDKVSDMFDSKTSIEGLPKQVYVYEPIYDSANIKKEFNIKDKNTFLIIEEGQEIGRFSFNDLSLGYQEIVEEIDTIINPKINRTKPIRKNVEETIEDSLNQETNGEATHTSEVSFE